MTTPMRMEEDRSYMTERILNLTLEIIYLLTGEDYKLVKGSTGEQLSTKTAPQFDSLKHERHHMQKILAVTKKMTELLTGEVSGVSGIVGHSPVTDKEWEYLEGHKELYKDVMMASQPALTSPDGSSRVVQMFSEGNKDLCKEIKLESSCKTNPPERDLHLLYSHQDPKEEDHAIPDHDQDEDVMAVKVEIKEEQEEMLVTDYQQYVEEDEEEEVAAMTRTVREEDTPTHNSTVHRWDLGSDLSPNWRGEDIIQNDSTSQRCPGERPSSSQYRLVANPITPNFHLWARTAPGPLFLSSSGEPGTVKGEANHTANTMTSTESHLRRQNRSPLAQQSYYHPMSGQSLAHPPLVRRRRSRAAGKPHSCPECGKCYIHASQLVRHRRMHTGEKPFACNVCNKGFAWKTDLNRHLRSHTGEKPFSCVVCGKCFSKKFDLTKHEKKHLDAS